MLKQSHYSTSQLSFIWFGYIPPANTHKLDLQIQLNTKPSPASVNGEIRSCTVQLKCSFRLILAEKKKAPLRKVRRQPWTYKEPRTRSSYIPLLLLGHLCLWPSRPGPEALQQGALNKRSLKLEKGCISAALPSAALRDGKSLQGLGGAALGKTVYSFIPYITSGLKYIKQNVEPQPYIILIWL